ncbi:MAG: signal peptidase I, partial [Promicromonosporaceae bacterium]|nr:signal peptidase I [Promicromonosporaceae bacterium]
AAGQAMGARRTGRKPRGRTTGERIASLALTALMVAAVVLAAAVTLVPRVVGAVPLTVLTGSMQPGIRPGDVVVSRPVNPADLSVGDVITFQPTSGDPTLVTHRIVALNLVGGELETIITRGDANGANDPPLVPEQVMGRVLYSVPLVGRLSVGTAAVSGLSLAGVALIGYALWVLLKPVPTSAEELGHA